MLVKHSSMSLRRRGELRIAARTSPGGSAAKRATFFVSALYQFVSRISGREGRRADAFRAAWTPTPHRTRLDVHHPHWRDRSVRGVVSHAAVIKIFAPPERFLRADLSFTPSRAPHSRRNESSRARQKLPGDSSSNTSAHRRAGQGDYTARTRASPENRHFKRLAMPRRVRILRGHTLISDLRDAAPLTCASRWDST